MAQQKGFLLAIEGTDGSGKGTQTRLLVSRLTEQGYPVATYTFPRHGEPSAFLVDAYLNGEFGDPQKLNPYTASLLYAVDRFAASSAIRKDLQKGKVVVLDRYVDSNAAHQGGKIRDPRARATYLTWLYNLEYHILNIPKPNLTFILRVPAKMGQLLIAKKAKRTYIKTRGRDGHERNLAHLQAAENAYRWLAEGHKRDHVLFNCMVKGKLLPPEEIHQSVWKILNRYL